MLIFKDKIILVTGSASGMGKSLSLSLASQGAIILANYHNRHKEAEDLLVLLKKSNNRSKTYQADISNCEEISEMFSSIKDSYGRIDGVVNCAGIVNFQSLESANTIDIGKQISVNLSGTIMIVKNAIELMSKAEGGVIVNVASLAAHIGQHDVSAYAASKGGVIAFTKSCAVELGPDIRVNSVSPGIIDTGINLDNLDQSQIEANRKKLLERIPLERMGSTADVVNLIEFLLSDRSSYITGQDIVIDGGWSIS